MHEGYGVGGFSDPRFSDPRSLDPRTYRDFPDTAGPSKYKLPAIHHIITFHVFRVYNNYALYKGKSSQNSKTQYSDIILSYSISIQRKLKCGIARNLMYVWGMVR